MLKIEIRSQKCDINRFIIVKKVHWIWFNYGKRLLIYYNKKRGEIDFTDSKFYQLLKRFLSICNIVPQGECFARRVMSQSELWIYQNKKIIPFFSVDVRLLQKFSLGRHLFSLRTKNLSHFENHMNDDKMQF